METLVAAGLLFAGWVLSAEKTVNFEHKILAMILPCLFALVELSRAAVCVLAQTHWSPVWRKVFGLFVVLSIMTSALNVVQLAVEYYGPRLAAVQKAEAKFEGAQKAQETAQKTRQEVAEEVARATALVDGQMARISEATKGLSSRGEAQDRCRPAV